MSQSPATAGPEVIVKRHKRGRLAKALLLSVIIFISGGACGWGAAALWGRRHPPVDMMPQPPVDYLVRQMSEQLLLTPDQSKKLEQVYQARFDALKKIRDDMLPKFKVEYDGLRTDVQKILTKEQFDQWDKRFDAVRNHMMPPPPPPPQRRGGPPGAGPPGAGPPGGGPPDGGMRGGGPDEEGPPGPPPRR